MSTIADAKRAFGAEIETEIDECEAIAAALEHRMRQNADDSNGLNGMKVSWNGVANMIQTAIEKLEDLRREQRKWLGTDKPQITEHVSSTVQEIRA